MGTTAEKLAYIKETKKLINEAINTKGITIDDLTPFREYANKILQIQTGIDTSDATAVSSDIVRNKTAYVDGKKITGNIPEVTNYEYMVGNNITDDYYLSMDWKLFSANIRGDVLYRDKSQIGIRVDPSDIAQNIKLTPEKIVSGNTILGVSGTYKGVLADKTIQADDIELELVQDITGNNDIGLSVLSKPLTKSKLYEQGSMMEMHPTFEQLATVLGITPDIIKVGEVICGVEGTYTGLNTSDATATADDIALDKTAYTADGKVTGTFDVEVSEIPAVGGTINQSTEIVDEILGQPTE